MKCPKCGGIRHGGLTPECPECPSERTALGPSDVTPCSVCADVRQRLDGHACSRLDGDHGRAAATMRSHEALLRVCDLLESWKVVIQNRNGCTWNQMDAGDTLRLRKSIDELEAAISPPNAERIHPEPTSQDNE